MLLEIPEAQSEAGAEADVIGGSGWVRVRVSVVANFLVSMPSVSENTTAPGEISVTGGAFTAVVIRSFLRVGELVIATLGFSVTVAVAVTADADSLLTERVGGSAGGTYGLR